MISFTLNNIITKYDGEPGVTLLEYLRHREIFSVKYGCDHGECGACTVLVDERAVNSCLILMPSLKDKTVETFEFLNDSAELTNLQQKFLTTGAIQCGYCTPGMLLSLVALFRQNGPPSEQDVREALAGNLCRCTGHVKPVKAVL